jgi:hypothetical protein
MESSNVTIPDRLRGAGLVMLVGSLPWVLMPFASLIGGNVSGGIGITIGGESPLVVTTSMLPWLAPLSVATAVGGLLVYYGRGIALALTLAVAWTVLGLVSQSGVFVIAAIVVYCILTGRRRLVPTSVGSGVAARQ